MTLIDTDGISLCITNENQLKDALSKYGFKLSKMNPDTKKMQKLRRELRFEEKNKGSSLMPDFTNLTIKTLKSEIILEQDNCKIFKQI